MSQSEEKSSLYEIYENQSLTSSTDEIYKDLASNINKSTSQHLQYLKYQKSHLAPHHPKNVITSPSFLLLKLARPGLNLAVLALLGNLYHQLALHLNSHYAISRASLSFVPESLIASFAAKLNNNNIATFTTAQAAYIVHGLEGILLGLALPLLDHLMDSDSVDSDSDSEDATTTDTTTTTTTSTTSTTSTPTDTTDTLDTTITEVEKSQAAGILRPLISLLGLLFAIRKIEWVSIDQLSAIWMLLNGGVWGLVDRDLVTLTYSLILVAYGLVNHHAELLLLAGAGAGAPGWSDLPGLINGEVGVVVDYLWFGGLLFGKIGRVLF